MGVERCLALWLHSAGVSCVLRFSLSLAFQKSSPETQPQLVLGLFFAETFPELPCTFPYLILNICSDVSDGPCLWTLPLPLFPSASQLSLWNLIFIWNWAEFAAGHKDFISYCWSHSEQPMLFSSPMPVSLPSCSLPPTCSLFTPCMFCAIAH